MIERVCAPFFHQADSSCKLANAGLNLPRLFGPQSEVARLAVTKDHTRAMSERAG